MNSESAMPAGDPNDSSRQARRGANAVAAGILLSRIAGLLREVVTARFLGVGAGVEAFKAALRIPNLLQNLLGEGVLSASFVPIYSQMVNEQRDDEGRALAGAVLGWLLVVAGTVVVLAVVFARPITRVLAWGLVEGTDRFELTVTLVRIVTPGIGLLVISAWCLALLNAHRRFFVAYVAPVLWNVAIIGAVASAAILGLADTGVATAMAYGALIGSGLQALVQLPKVLRVTGTIRPTLRRSTPGLATVARRFSHVATGRGSVQLSAYIDLIAASLLAAGAIAAISYAQVLYLLPIGLFGMSIAASELPALATIDHQDRKALVDRLEAGLDRIAFFVLPTTVVFVVLGDLVVGTVFGGGRFDADATTQVGIVLAAYALGLPASTSARLLQSALYGLGDARTPARAAMVRVTVATLVGVVAMLPLDAWQVMGGSFVQAAEPGWQIASVEARSSAASLLRLGAVGLAIGAACGAWVEFALLRHRLKRSIGTVRMLGTQTQALVGASIIATGVALAVRGLPQLSATSMRVNGLIGMGVVGVLYLAACHALGVHEANHLQRQWRTATQPFRPGHRRQGGDETPPPQDQ